MERGIHNAEVIDEVAFDHDSDEMALIMYATKEWDDVDTRIAELQDKMSKYVEFAAGGQLAEEFPDRAESKVRFQLNCDYLPNEKMMLFLERINTVLMKGGMRLLVNCTEARDEIPKKDK